MSADTPSNAETPTKPVHVESEAELDALVTEHELVLVDFYTKGCTLCQSIEPVLGNVARSHLAARRTESGDVARAEGSLVVAMCNPREDLSLVERFNVRSVPTLILFEDGSEVGRLAEGFQGAQAIVDFVSESRTE